jgi:hypothetical protein
MAQPGGYAGVMLARTRTHLSAAAATARITSMIAMIAVPISDTAQMRRLVEFAGDAAELADRRCDVELRHLITDLHADLMRLRGDDE